MLCVQVAVGKSRPQNCQQLLASTELISAWRSVQEHCLPGGLALHERHQAARDAMSKPAMAALDASISGVALLLLSLHALVTLWVHSAHEHASTQLLACWPHTT
jgi:hypothetical protein